MKRQFLSKKINNFLSDYDSARLNQVAVYRTGYVNIKDKYEREIGLPYNIISSSNYDPTIITTPIQPLQNQDNTSHTETVPNQNIYYWESKEFLNNDLIWGVDRYYVINIDSNGNSYRIGFYADSSPFQSSNISSLYPPTFYYESFTGHVIMGGNILKKIDVNLKTIMIRVDSYFNFYVGTSLTNYWLIGNCTSYMNAINNNYYTLRWGYEVNVINNLDITFTIIYSSYSELINKNTDGITWPNYRFGGVINNDRWTITDNISQSISKYTVYNILNNSNNITIFGQRTSFTLKCNDSGLEQVIILFSNASLQNNLYNQIFDIYSELGNYIGYDSLSNKYFSSSDNSKDPSSYPNLTNSSGQIYFRIEENGDIYSSADYSNANLIYNSSFQVYHIYIITKGYSTEISKSYSFIKNNSKPIVANPTNAGPIIPTPTPTPTPSQSPTDTITPTTPPSGTSDNTLPQAQFSYYTTSITDSPPIPYGKGRSYTITFDNVNKFKIGFYSNSTQDNATKYTTSTNPPQFYYNTEDRGVYIGNSLKLTLPNNWNYIYLLVDSDNSFYVGYSESYYVYIDKITNYLNLLFPDTYTLRLGWEVYTSSTNYVLNVTSSKIIEPQNYILDWPNNRIFSPSLNDYTYTTQLNNIGGFYTFLKFFNLSNSFSINNTAFTLKINKKTSSLIIIVIYADIDIPNNTISSNFLSILTGEHLIYNSETNTYIKNGLSLNQPSSYPNLNELDGQIYVKYLNGKVYSGGDVSSSLYICDLPNVQLYGGVFTFNLNNDVDIFEFVPSIPKQLVPIVEKGDTFPQVPLGYTSSIITGVWNQNLTNTIVGQEYIAGDLQLENNSWAYGWQSFITGSPTNVSSYKIGIGITSNNIVRYIDNQGAFFPHQTSGNISLYSYYDSSSGNIYHGDKVVRNIGQNLQYIGIGVDYNNNVYYFKSLTLCFNVGDLGLYTSNNKCQFSTQINMIFTPSISNPPLIFNYDFNVSYTAKKLSYILDDAFNNLIYDPSSQKYNLTSTASSSSQTLYKFLQTSRYCKSSTFNRRFLFQFEIAPTDVILALGRNTNYDFVPGNEYDANTIQNVAHDKFEYQCITYRQSLTGVFMDSALVYNLDLGLNVNNSSVIIDIVGPNQIKMGQNVNNETVVVDLSQLPLNGNVDSYYFIGIFVSSLTPCKINVIDVNKLLYPPFVPGGFPSTSQYYNKGSWLNPNLGPVNYAPSFASDGKIVPVGTTFPITLSTSLFIKPEIFATSTYVFEESEIPNAEYIIVDNANIYSYGSQVLAFNTFEYDYKYGVGLTNHFLRNIYHYVLPLAILSSKCSLYYYYEKTTGKIYKNDIPIYQFDVGLKYLGIGIDGNLNVYIAKSPSQVYFIGDLVEYANNNKVQTSAMFGMSFINNTSLNKNERLGRSLDNSNIISLTSSNEFPYNSRYCIRLYDTISTNYKITSFASSQTQQTYKYLEFTYPILQSIGDSSNYILNLQFTTAPDDFIIAWGASSEKNPLSINLGDDYTFNDIVSLFKLIYMSSTNSFYYKGQVICKINNITLTNGSTLYIKIINGAKEIVIGQTQYSTYSYTLLSGTQEWWTTPLCGILVKTSSPSTMCQIDILDN